jgi:hypothetical protein
VLQLAFSQYNWRFAVEAGTRTHGAGGIALGPTRAVKTISNIQTYELAYVCSHEKVAVLSHEPPSTFWVS